MFQGKPKREEPHKEKPKDGSKPKEAKTTYDKMPKKTVEKKPGSQKFQHAKKPRDGNKEQEKATQTQHGKEDNKAEDLRDRGHNRPVNGQQLGGKGKAQPE